MNLRERFIRLDRRSPIKIDKVHSEQNRCIQLVDYVAGASRAKYERSDDTIDILLEKVSVARRL